MGKEKRAKHAAKKEAREMAARSAFVPKASILSPMRPHYDRTSPVPEVVQIPPYVGLTLFEHGKGNWDSFIDVLGRLTFGRMLAHLHYREDDIAEMIHNGIGLLLQEAGQHENDATDILIPLDIIEEVRSCLKAIDTIQGNLTPEEQLVFIYQFGQYELSLRQKTYEEVNDVPWEVYKKNAGW